MRKLSNCLLILLVLGLFLNGCSTSVNNPAGTSAAESDESNPAVSTIDTHPLIIYAPASTSSIPVILAAKNIEDAQLTLYTNQSQANTLFLRGEIDILVTGLSVGVDLYRNDVPVQVANSFVSGLSYLVTYGSPVTSLSDLVGQEIYIPFEGSPIEEVTAYLVGQTGLAWEDDITPVYSPFESSIELLKQGQAGAVILPEPNVSLLENQPDIYISLDLAKEWNRHNPGDAGYPQVGSFVNANWASEHPQQIEQFNQALTEAIAFVERDPSGSVEAVKNSYKFPPEILLKSLNRTGYTMLTGPVMQQTIANYYVTIGKPLDETFSDFYYLSAQ